MSSEVQQIFTKSQQANGDWHHELLPQLSAKAKQHERRRLVQIIPWTLNESRLLTDQEYLENGYHNMRPGECHFLKKGTETIPHARYLSPIELQELNIMEDISKLERIVLDPTFEDELRKSERPDRKNLGGLDLGITKQPFRGQGKTGCIQLGGIARANLPRATQAIQLLGELVPKVIKSSFPFLDTDIHERQWGGNASITLGHEDNHFTSSVQINFANPDKSLKSSLGDKGTLHVDWDDDGTKLTVLIFLSHLSEDFFPGRFNITSTKLSCTAARYSILVFTGTHPHFATGLGPYNDSIPQGHPFRYTPPPAVRLPAPLPQEWPFKRIALVNYPKKVLLQPEVEWLNAQLYTEQALSIFGTRRNFYEWKMRCCIKSCIEQIRSLTSAGFTEYETPEFWMGLFTWVNQETGVVESPRRSIAELALKWAGTEDKEWNDLNKLTDHFICVKYFSEQRQKGKITWTHLPDSVREAEHVDDGNDEEESEQEDDHEHSEDEI